MANDIFKYPLDLTGNAVNNRVIDEEHTIGTRTRRVFAPEYGPFFGKNAIVKDAANGRILVPTVDYIFLHSYKEAEDRAGDAIYAAVMITNPEVSNRIQMTLNYIGGEFSFSTYAIIEAIKAIINEDRPVYWGELIGVPSQFAPAPHLHSIYHTYGWKTMVDAIGEVRVAIETAGVANQQLLFQQLRQMREEIVDIAMSLAGAFSVAADELALL